MNILKNLFFFLSLLLWIRLGMSRTFISQYIVIMLLYISVQKRNRFWRRKLQMQLKTARTSLTNRMHAEWTSFSISTPKLLLPMFDKLHQSNIICMFRKSISIRKHKTVLLYITCVCNKRERARYFLVWNYLNETKLDLQRMLFYLFGWLTSPLFGFPTRMLKGLAAH